MEHKDIRIEFELGGRSWEAVGFLEKDEDPVTNDEMLARTDQDGQVVGEEDWQFILERRTNLPKELNPYYLVTKRPFPGHPLCVSCLCRDSGEWCGIWGYCGSMLLRGSVLVLVLRRRA